MAYNAHHRVDPNQKKIAGFLRELDMSVEFLSDLGKGIPDLLVGLKVTNRRKLPEKTVVLTLLIELKKDEKQSLRERQVEWWNKWKGQVGLGFDELSVLELVREHVESLGLELFPKVKSKLFELRYQRRQSDDSHS